MTQPAAPEADDVFAFADEEAEDAPVGPASGRSAGVPWQVLVVDDDPQVQLVTRLAFTHLQLDGRPVQLHNASSAAEARTLLESRDDIAAAIVDVVMESEEAGLELVRWIRHQASQRCARVILRTGQPGFAPEESVLRDYDINDYWPKTELTAHRMRTLLTGQLRSYRDLRLIESQRNDLGRVVAGVAELFSRDGLEDLLGAMRQQLRMLLPGSAVALQICSVRELAHAEGLEVLAREGGETLDEPAVRPLLLKSLASGHLVQEGDRLGLMVSVGGAEGSRGVALLATGVAPMEEWVHQTFELLVRNALAVLASHLLFDEQRALLRAVERFVPDRLVRMTGADDVRQLHAGDHRRGRKWVLFADLRGFTTLSERLAPGEVHATLQEFFAAISPVVESHHGVVDKYLGDGLMALFPGEEPPPLRACHEMFSALDGLNRVRLRRGLPALQLSMALHGGAVLLCVLGSDRRVEITAVSDTVNVASRLEQLTRVMGVSLLVSESVFEALPAPEQVGLRPLGLAAVRGRRGDVRLYDASPEAVGPGFAPAERMRAVVERLEAGAPEADALLLQLQTEFPDDRAVEALVLREVGRQPSAEVAARSAPAGSAA